MKIANTSAPEACFSQLKAWFEQRLAANHYPIDWQLENTFESCMPIPVFRYPIQLLATGEFAETELVQTGWNFIHKDLKGNEACFLVSQSESNGEIQYRFNQANYGHRSTDIKGILNMVSARNFKPEFESEFQVALIAGGPKYFYDIWLKPLNNSGVNIFIDLPPNIYNIDQERGISIDVKDFKGYHSKLTRRVNKDMKPGVETEEVRPEMKSGL